jgi:hypothetical protein
MATIKQHMRHDAGINMSDQKAVSIAMREKRRYIKAAVLDVLNRDTLAGLCLHAVVQKGGDGAWNVSQAVWVLVGKP